MLFGTVRGGPGLLLFGVFQYACSFVLLFNSVRFGFLKIWILGDRDSVRFGFWEIEIMRDGNSDRWLFWGAAQPPPLIVCVVLWVPKEFV